jgi:hypothetical protein
MSRAVEILDKRFGRLVVLRIVGRADKSCELIYRCQCDCGQFVEVPGTRLRRGKTKSCGCLASELIAKRNRGQPADAVSGVQSETSSNKGQESDCNGNVAVSEETMPSAE